MDVAENAGAEVECRRALPEFVREPAATEAALHQPVGQAQDQARAQCVGSPLQELAFEPAHGLHGPLGGVFAGARRNPPVRLAFLPEKTQHGIKWRKANGAVAEPLGVQPALVEAQPRRQDVRNALMEARNEDATDARVTHKELGIGWIRDLDAFRSHPYRRQTHAL